MKSSKIILLVFLIGIAIAAGLLAQIMSQLPNVENINSYLPSEATIIYSNEGEILARIHEEENRRVIPLSKISKNLISAIIATEDSNFYRHHGLDIFGIIRAGIRNLTAGRFVEGGSTITQQLARNLFLTRKKTILRKVAEAILALQIEHRLSKEEILELYLNQIYFGHNAYGVDSASFLYFGKEASDLTLAEASLLSGVIEAPERLSPYKNFEAAKKRQKAVLYSMIRRSMITPDGADNAFAEKITLNPERIKSRGQIGAYFINYVMENLIEKYGSEIVYKGGLKVYTTLSASMQTHADRVVEKYVKEEGKKYNFSQASLLSIDPKNGYIKAMVGGLDFRKSQFNRAIQAKRPPGSSFKPFIYLAALEKGFSPGNILADKPVTFRVFPNQWNPDGTWSPKNFDRKFHGNVTMRSALERSLNIPSIKLLEMVGAAPAINIARRMGIQSNLEYALALALGVYDVSLLEMTSAYCVLANNGIRTEPIAILKVLSRDNVVLEENKPRETRVLDQNITAVMVDIMKGVLLRGTGVQGRLDRESAAKTGTTEEFKDAWFIGFVPQLTTGVWVGNDNNQSMNGVAEVAVCPRMWKDFMQHVLINMPEARFPNPEGMEKITICKDSGLLPNRNCPQNLLVEELFFKDNIPNKLCTVNSKNTIEEESAAAPSESAPEWLQDEQ